MSVVRLTAARTLGHLRAQPSTPFVIVGFLAAAGLSFAFNLARAEGGLLPLSTLWAVSAAPILPFLAACVGMDAWSGETQSGRIAGLLTAPVREGDLAVGKFLGVWASVLISAALSLGCTLAALRLVSPSALVSAHWPGFITAFAAIALQSALWCAVSTAASACFRHAVAAVCATAAATSLVPRMLWAGIIQWAPGGASAFGEMPLDAHAFDLASGVYSTGTVISYLALTVLMIFLGTTRIVALRLRGRESRRGAVKFAAVRFTATVFTVLLAALALRMDAVVELPFGAVRTGFSERTRRILTDAEGAVTVTAFVSRDDNRYRSVMQLLRAFRRTASAQGGCNVEIRTVDPAWDFGAARRLVREGVGAGSVVFAKGRRRAVLPLEDGFDERSFASAIQRVTSPPRRQIVYWTHGHGESSFDDYGAYGLSDAARELSRDGYRNLPLDLSTDTPIPSDCALIVIAGARDDFARAETARLDAYLRQGGRLLLLASLSRHGGLASMLSVWGLRSSDAVLSGVRTISGTDVVVTEFSAHPAVAPLAGSRIILDSPVALMPSAAAATGRDADAVTFTDLARAGGVCVAAALERGRGAGDDLALRPTRIVAVGDGLFALNGKLRANGGANLDFLQNCVSYLAGGGDVMADGRTAGALVTGLDRQGRIRFALVSGGALPLAVLLVMLAAAAVRRRRK